MHVINSNNGGTLVIIMCVHKWLCDIYRQKPLGICLLVINICLNFQKGTLTWLSNSARPFRSSINIVNAWTKTLDIKKFS